MEIDYGWNDGIIFTGSLGSDYGLSHHFNGYVLSQVHCDYKVNTDDPDIIWTLPSQY